MFLFYEMVFFCKENTGKRVVEIAGKYEYHATKSKFLLFSKEKFCSNQNEQND